MAQSRSPQPEQPLSAIPVPAALPVVFTDEEWRKRLTPEEYQILRKATTEAPGSGEYLTTRDKGVYRCRGCGAQLFDSETKFDSNCGWPSFDDAIPSAIREFEDRSLGRHRIEIRCASCDSHLGHVFRGEQMTEKNTRHCVNSLAIRFDPS